MQHYFVVSTDHVFQGHNGGRGHTSSPREQEREETDSPLQWLLGLHKPSLWLAKHLSLCPEVAARAVERRTMLEMKKLNFMVAVWVGGVNW